MSIPIRVLLYAAALACFVVQVVHLQYNYPLKTYTVEKTIILEQPTSTEVTPQQTAPDMDLMCRTFHGTLFELVARVMFSYAIFWPHKQWDVKLIVVLDAEHETDHRVGALLEAAFPNIVVFYEVKPLNTLDPRIEEEGHSRSQWSNFYSDLYSDAEFVGIIDSDAEFSFHIDPLRHLFVKNASTGALKPIIRGSTQQVPYMGCVKFMTGFDWFATFMYAFPFVIKRKHLPLVRAHVIKATGAATFEQAWHNMHKQFAFFGQFDIIGTYLWHFHKDEYEWQVQGLLQTVQAAPLTMHHLPMHMDVKLTATKYHDQLCIQSTGRASDCAYATTDHSLAKMVPFTDYWPLSGGTGGYDPAAAQAHNIEGAAWTSVFDGVVADTARQAWWRDPYITNTRTKDPTTKK